MPRPLLAALLALLLSFTPRATLAQPEPAPAPAPAPAISPAPAPAPASVPKDARAEARASFDSGVGHFDRSEWSAALADFLRSRALFPTKAATKNAAVCFRREGRFDEALETFEALLREFPDLAPGDRAFAEKESAELRVAIGSIEIAGAEPGAAVVIDGRARGSYPTSAPLRVAAGSHVVRVYKEGFGPFEARVDVAGRQSALVEAHLSPLTQAGRLSVTENGGRALDVVIDNVVVGKTPWEGAIAVGLHAVVLRGEGDLGTQPATTTVRLGDVTTLALAAEPLTSTLRIVPVPAGANVSIDAVVVGQGVWEGKLREGEHVVEVVAEGFLLARRVVRLTKSERTAETVVLERDPSSPLWRAAHPARVFVELDVGPAVGLAFGGDVRGACSGGCSAAIPIGLAATAHAGYELSSGITLGLDAGYLVVSANASRRAAAVLPKGLAPNAGTLDDALGLQGGVAVHLPLRRGHLPRLGSRCPQGHVLDVVGRRVRCRCVRIAFGGIRVSCTGSAPGAPVPVPPGAQRGRRGARHGVGRSAVMDRSPAGARGTAGPAGRRRRDVRLADRRRRLPALRRAESRRALRILSAAKALALGGLGPPHGDRCHAKSIVYRHDARVPQGDALGVGSCLGRRRVAADGRDSVVDADVDVARVAAEVRIVEERELDLEGRLLVARRVLGRELVHAADRVDDDGQVLRGRQDHATVELVRIAVRGGDGQGRRRHSDGAHLLDRGGLVTPRASNHARQHHNRHDLHDARG
jgi:hypothetical protein